MINLDVALILHHRQPSVRLAILPYQFRHLCLHQIVLTNEKLERLYQEGVALNEDAAAFEERCGGYAEGFELDRDYMTFIGGDV